MGRVLVVDDEPEACRALKEFLILKNYKVQTARDGKTALKEVKTFKPHIVLLDMNMPGMDGVEVLKEIRKIDTSIGVIMVTVVSDHERAKSTLELGAFDYITKPVDLNYLETVVLVKAVDLQC
ncbi:MAG: response regulator [Deltaproteobacteria bacterium]|nr:response regulator [Deltaproteobacteria bacterium]MBW2206607.1 response regulator [Deltaproteobacteria bacterium]